MQASRLRPTHLARPLLVPLALALALLGRPARASERIVVMEFTGANVGAEVLRAVADRTRLSALEPARKVGYEVMTRQSTTMIIEQMGGACLDGQCEIEVARTVGAALVVTGEVRRLGETFLADVKLHDTAKGTLLSGETYSAASELDVVERTAAATEKLLGTGFERYFGKTIPALRKGGLDPLRRWYAELRVSRPVMKKTPNPVDGDERSPVFPSLRAGYRLSRTWAVELGGGGGMDPWTGPAPQLSGGNQNFVVATWATAGVAWRVTPTSAWSFAAEVGAAELDGTYFSVGTTSVNGMAPVAGLEARLDLPLGAWSFGLRAGGLYFNSPLEGKTEEWMPNPNTVWLKPGDYLTVSVGGALRYSY